MQPVSSLFLTLAFNSNELLIQRYWIRRSVRIHGQQCLECRIIDPSLAPYILPVSSNEKHIDYVIKHLLKIQ
jgi:hypothetical protein